MKSRPGVVSVVTTNYRAAEHTITCLRSLADLDWPAERLEVICVENASADGSVERIRAAVSDVNLVEAAANGGFTGGCNLGASRANGEYIAFLSNEARPDPRWLAEAVAVLEDDRSIGCVACKVVGWDGSVVDCVDGALSWFGMCYRPNQGRPDGEAWDTPADVLFGAGAAMIVRADLFRELRGFDERFFMFYHDVDFGWRLNLLGHRVRYVPSSLAFCRPPPTEGKFMSWRERYLLERNALLSLYKNLADETLSRTLAPALALAVHRSVSLGGDDPNPLDLQRNPDGDDRDRVEVARVTLAGPYAIDYFVAVLPSLDQSRRDIQARRVRSDQDLIPLFRKPMQPLGDNDRYVAGYHAVVAAFDVEDVFSTRGSETVTGLLDAPAEHELVLALREVAASRAERITDLQLQLHAANDRAAKSRARLAKSQKSVEKLKARLDALGSSSGRPRGGTPRRVSRRLSTPRRFARKLARRLPLRRPRRRA